MIIIYKEIKDGKLQFTQEELEELLEKARKEGYNEGYKDGQNTFYRYPTVTDPSIPTINSSIIWSSATGEIK